MMKNTIKLATISTAILFLSGCFSASSINRAAPATPVTAQQTSPMLAKEYVLSGDFLFDFDKSNLSAKGKSTLDNISKDLKTANISKVSITGYTDRLGSDAYNLKLSQARANTAKAYLQAQGVQAKINAIGRGKANQIKACKGESGQALKDCLKPNRRVVIHTQ